MPRTRFGPARPGDFGGGAFSLIIGAHRPPGRRPAVSATGTLRRSPHVSMPGGHGNRPAGQAAAEAGAGAAATAEAQAAGPRRPGARRREGGGVHQLRVQMHEAANRSRACSVPSGERRARSLAVLPPRHRRLPPPSSNPQGTNGRPPRGRYSNGSYRPIGLRVGRQRPQGTVRLASACPQRALPYSPQDRSPPDDRRIGRAADES